MGKSQPQCPACPTGHASDGAILRIINGAVTLINVRDKLLDQSLTEARTWREIPMAVIREDNNEGRGFAGKNQFIDYIHCTKPNPLILCIGLTMQKVEDRVTLLCFFIIAWRQIDQVFLR